MIQIILSVVLAVERHGFDIDILIAVVRGIDHQVVSILKMDRSLLEQRAPTLYWVVPELDKS